MPELLTAPSQWYAYLMRRRVRILMYHSISNDPGDPLAIAADRFRSQMSLLSENGYKGVAVGRAYRHLTDNRCKQRLIGLTFDDGFQDFLKTAVPILQEFGFNATLFVPVGMIGKTSLWSSYRKNRPLLHWEELRQVASKGCEIGSHTFSHPDLRVLTSTDLAQEVSGSKQALENALQIPIEHFAYPGGTFTGREIAAVASAGYQTAAIVGGRWGNGPETPRLGLKRETMLQRDTLTEFGRKVYGYYELFWLGRWLLGQIAGKRRRSAVYES